MHDSEKCIFCDIALARTSSRIVWQDSNYVAVLTPYPNTSGFTVLFPRKHIPSDGLQLDDRQLFDLMSAARKVGTLLRERLQVARVGLILEGYGINHVHAKLIPMHGIPEGPWKPITSAPEERRYYTDYPGFIASHDGPLMNDADLDLIHKKLLS
ncbi:MAG: HIT family protein [Burkholderiales bacterium]